MPCNCCEMENNTFGEDEARSNLKDYDKRRDEYPQRSGGGQSGCVDQPGVAGVL